MVKSKHREDSATMESMKFESTLPHCEQLHKNLQVSWEIFGSQITFTLAGQIEEDEYMALGISGSHNSSRMLGSDVAVSYVEGYLGVTVDYNITGPYPCSNILGPRRGVCPDTQVGGVENLQFQTFHREDGITSVTYRRDPTNAGDSGDKIYQKEGFTYLVWAIGKYDKYNKQPGYHHTYPKGDVKIELGRKTPRKNCHPFTRPPEKNKIETWGPLRVKDRKVQRFTVRLGPPGLWKGDLGLTGRAGPGVVYYVNGLMTPELFVKRGRLYEFRVECGSSPHNTRFYHPFYLTDDPAGGYHHYSNKEREEWKSSGYVEGESSIDQYTVGIP
ncbi:hypothetical protein LAZ67_16000469 [Cordylochernes scorpioides]|uniref:DOMON domain-containing protein n=1 Tax=Cordylochernes scorpioides TaxID=51811 RepID=A0ABY6LAL5_9ARAC|nr:hypothetical protein LAZ67_16000469 [Cordylochernes scorpioides]